MTEWLVRLKGHAFDLEELSNRFASAKRNVRNDDDYYYLRSSDFDQMPDPDAVHERAQALIAYMNGATKLYAGGGYRPVEFDGLSRIDEEGRGHHHVFLSAAVVEGRSRMTATPSVGGTVNAPRPPSEAESLVDLADRNEKVADALRFYEGGDWVNLYKAWEVVCDAAGGSHQVVKNGWATRSGRSRFTGTAQSREELGDEARHASEKYKAPKNPMTLWEARAFVQSVIWAWVQTL